MNKLQERRDMYDKIYTDDMIDKLIKEMNFKYFNGGGDHVFIGVEGKRPFGNSDISGDMINIMFGDIEKELGDYEYDYIAYRLAKRINERLKN